MQLSSYWGSRAATAHAKSIDPFYPKVWTAQVISIIWKYSRSLWAYRNTIVHGATEAEITAKIRSALDDQARSLYTTFQTSPHFILTCHHYLFTCRSLHHLFCWSESPSYWSRIYRFSLLSRDPWRDWYRLYISYFHRININIRFIPSIIVHVFFPAIYSFSSFCQLWCPPPPPPS